MTKHFGVFFSVHSVCNESLVKTRQKLENVAINDVLSLNSARRDAIANLKCILGPLDTTSLISMVSFTCVWQSLVGFRLPCATADNEAERKIDGGWVKYPVLFSPISRPKFTKFSDDVGDPSYVPTPLPDCLCHVSFGRSSLEVVENPNKCRSFLAPNFGGGTTPAFLQQIVSAIYSRPFAKVWLSSVC